ncbi:hypothetical protein BV22DRAFT_924437 [Leucogyrophana mollusca]|uniref:Uncharacterized protein n=1 Tax=Leucogyrophana mollusca TaxID=85980 RepID=A0ACB8AX01_9AGAM|nr:hypothetical protein BV22DRAFT_924437 [Leucogyrophana mollusca]
MDTGENQKEGADCEHKRQQTRLAGRLACRLPFWCAHPAFEVNRWLSRPVGYTSPSPDLGRTSVSWGVAHFGYVSRTSFFIAVSHTSHLLGVSCVSFVLGQSFSSLRPPISFIPTSASPQAGRPIGPATPTSPQRVSVPSPMYYALFLDMAIDANTIPMVKKPQVVRTRVSRSNFL